MEKSTESEVKLVIINPQPDRIIRELSEIDNLAGYRILPVKVTELYDYYFDTPMAHLRADHLSLRVRFQDSKKFLTLKGKTRFTDWGGISRIEIEMPWNKKNFNYMMQKFPASLDLSEPYNYLPDDPVKTLKSAGFIVIQARRTRRITRNVLNRAKSGNPVAELALDQVDYNLYRQRLSHFEIEIEEREYGIRPVQEIMTDILKTYGDSLMSWSISKLALGIILKKMEEKNQIQKKMTESGHLTAAAYQWILENVTDFRK
ncbi:MAG: CYTH domain-containing protein [Calditrichaeota bacterium]|nr:CYTH domain-containing protein [Calditrichota bacterium]RQW06949.1 MAG: CYTH domain-containing protein [Calditrichota bacterium]